MAIRKSKTKRETKETSVSVSLNVDGSGKTSIDTGIRFLDHLITSFGKHSMLYGRLTKSSDVSASDSSIGTDA